MNRRGWIVLVSIPSDDGSFCVDLFEHPAGGFGYQHFRSDAENQGAWTTIGSPEAGYASETEAAANAAVNVPWLTQHSGSRRHLEDWLETVA